MIIIFLFLASIEIIPPIHADGQNNFFQSTSSARTWIVDNEGDGDFITIQEAINNANIGDTIKVYSGTYNENVHIFKDNLIFTGINFELGIGSDEGYPVISANHVESCIYIVANQISITGFIIKNCGNNSKDAGIKIQSNELLIEQNTIIDNKIGILLDGGDNNIIGNNNISSNSYAIILQDAHHNEITNNIILENDVGIRQESSTYVDISQNELNANHFYGLVLDVCQYNSIFSNDFLENENAIYLINSKINTFNQNTIMENKKGIYLDLSSNRNNFSENVISSNENEGVIINGCSTNTFYDNQLNANQNAFSCNQISLHEFIDNTIENNNDNSFVLKGSQENIISKNIIISKKFKDSILLSKSHYNYISENEISNAGISFYDSKYNNIFRNNIASSLNGLYLNSSIGNSIYENIITLSNFDGIYLGSSSNNNIFHNSLIENNRNAFDNGNNNWDDGYPNGGNYWSNYDEPGEGANDNFGGQDQSEPYSDGIADEPYLIAGSNNKDNYPLIHPWGPPRKPITPQGISQGLIGKEYRYTTSSIDPNQDHIQYGWDWDGDGAVDEWTIPYDSGETISITHAWVIAGDYNIYVKAIDENGAESDWSDPLPVVMPKGKNHLEIMNNLLYHILFLWDFYNRFI